MDQVRPLLDRDLGDLRCSGCSIREKAQISEGGGESSSPWRNEAWISSRTWAQRLELNAERAQAIGVKFARAIVVMLSSSEERIQRAGDAELLSHRPI